MITALTRLILPPFILYSCTWLHVSVNVRHNQVIFSRNRMCSAGVAILLRQRGTTVTVGFFADPICAYHTPNAYASKLCDFSQFTICKCGRRAAGYATPGVQKVCALTSLFWMFGVLQVSVCPALSLPSFLCTVGVSVSVFQFAVNTRSDSKCGRCFFRRDVIC